LGGLRFEASLGRGRGERVVEEGRRQKREEEGEMT
jgi:hypothetical protein